MCVRVRTRGVCLVQLARLDPVQLRALGPCVAQKVRDGEIFGEVPRVWARNTESLERHTLLFVVKPEECFTDEQCSAWIASILYSLGVNACNNHLLCTYYG